MADVLEEYVTQIIDKKMQNSDYLIAIPSKVTQVLSNGMCVVQLISNGSEYCVPNWSGAVLEVGDNVQLYYKGKILSDRTAYIGAAAYMVNRQLGLVEGNFIVDEGSISSAYPKGRRSIPISINIPTTIAISAILKFGKSNNFTSIKSTTNPLKSLSIKLDTLPAKIIAHGM